MYLFKGSTICIILYRQFPCLRSNRTIVDPRQLIISILELIQVDRHRVKGVDILPLLKS